MTLSLPACVLGWNGCFWYVCQLVEQLTAFLKTAVKWRRNWHLTNVCLQTFILFHFWQNGLRLIWYLTTEWKCLVWFSKQMQTKRFGLNIVLSHCTDRRWVKLNVSLFLYIPHSSWKKKSFSVKDMFFVVKTAELSWLSVRFVHTVWQEEPVELVCFYSAHEEPMFIIHENMSPYLVSFCGVLRCVRAERAFHMTRHQNLTDMFLPHNTLWSFKSSQIT